MCNIHTGFSKLLKISFPRASAESAIVKPVKRQLESLSRTMHLDWLLATFLRRNEKYLC
jgi:hypothetical protein